MPTPQTINTIVLVITLLLLVLTFKNRLYGLLAYTCISMTRPGLLFPFLGKIRFELVVALILLLSIFLSKEKLQLISLKRNKISQSMFIFFMVILLSMIQAIDFNTSYDRTWEFLKVYAFFLMIVAFIKTKKDLKIFLWTFGFIMAWIGYEPIYNFINGVVRERGDATYAEASTGRGSGHVALGIYLLQGISFLWYLSISDKKNITKIAGLLLLGISFIALIISGSRGAIVGLVIFALLISYFSRKRLLYILAGTALIVVALLSMGSGYLSYMDTILDFGQSDVSARSRFDGLRNGLEMLVRRPILGVGPGCYPVARKMWFGWGLWAHNVYGEVAGDLGLLGILSWGTFLYCYLKKCFRLRQNLNYGSWYHSVITAVIVGNFVCLALGFFAHILYSYFWYMSAGIVIIIEDLLRKERLTPGVAT